jgi:hypothetical protein
MTLAGVASLGSSPAVAGADGHEVMQPIDRAILEALSGPARPSVGTRTIPTLKPDHGRWWQAEAARVGPDIVLRIHRPAGDLGLTSQCIVSKDDRRWSHEAGNPQATARGAVDPVYSVRFPGDFEGPSMPSVSGTFHIAWTAVYNADSWVLLNSASFRTVYKGTLRF